MVNINGELLGGIVGRVCTFYALKGISNYISTRVLKVRFTVHVQYLFLLTFFSSFLVENNLAQSELGFGSIFACT